MRTETDGERDMRKLIVAFRNYANAPKKKTSQHLTAKKKFASSLK
jgi:hypothetical protein